MGRKAGVPSAQMYSVLQIPPVSSGSKILTPNKWMVNQQDGNCFGFDGLVPHRRLPLLCTTKSVAACVFEASSMIYDTRIVINP